MFKVDLIYAKRLETIKSLIELRVSEGWRLQGGICVNFDSRGQTYTYYQTLVREGNGNNS